MSARHRLGLLPVAVLAWECSLRTELPLPGQPAAIDAGWQLAWADEFDVRAGVSL